MQISEIKFAKFQTSIDITVWFQSGSNYLLNTENVIQYDLQLVHEHWTKIYEGGLEQLLQVT